MLPARFELHRPQTVEEALALLARLGDEASAYAGGTELLVAMKARVLRYAHVVDLKRVAGLAEITLRSDGTLSIGALCTHRTIAAHRLVREHQPAYAELSANVANIRVRAAGTLGGNLCFAEPHADPPALLSALGAELCLVGSEGARRLPVCDFLLGEFSTARQEGELLLSIEIPAPSLGQRAAYRSFGHLERPAAGVAVVRVNGAEGPAWRAWVGSVSARPTQLLEAERAVRGLDGVAAVKTLEQAAEREAQTLPVHDDIHGSAEYKRHLVSVLVRRAAEACLT